MDRAGYDDSTQDGRSQSLNIGLSQSEPYRHIGGVTSLMNVEDPGRIEKARAAGPTQVLV